MIGVKVPQGQSRHHSTEPSALEGLGGVSLVGACSRLESREMNLRKSVTRLTIAITLSSRSSLAAFEETLASVLEYQPTACDIVVLHSIPYDDPWGTREDGVQFESMALGTSRVTMFNCAVQAARGEIVLLLAPGSELQRGAPEVALESFAHDTSLGWLIPAVVASHDARSVRSLGSLFQKSDGQFRPFRRGDATEAAMQSVQTSGVVLVPHTEAVYFRREAIASLGEISNDFSEQIALADAAMRMRLLGWDGCVSVAAAVASLQPLTSESPFQRGRQLERLYRRWRPRGTSSWTHWLVTQGEFWSAIPFPRAFLTLLGRLSALMVSEPPIHEVYRDGLLSILGEPQDTALAETILMADMPPTKSYPHPVVFPIPVSVASQKSPRGDGAAA